MSAVIMTSYRVFGGWLWPADGRLHLLLVHKGNTSCSRLSSRSSSILLLSVVFLFVTSHSLTLCWRPWPPVCRMTPDLLMTWVEHSRLLYTDWWRCTLKGKRLLYNVIYLEIQSINFHINNTGSLYFLPDIYSKDCKKYRKK